MAPRPPRRRVACPHGDQLCPCQDGLACHYEPTTDTEPWPCPRTRTTSCDCRPCPQCGWPIENPAVFNRCDHCREVNRERRRHYRRTNRRKDLTA